MVGVGSSVSIVSHDGVSGANISIAEFVATHMTEESTADSYVFDRDHFFGSHAPELLAKLVVPRYLSTAISADAVHTYLTMGPAGSGVQMHMHGAGWNLQLHGSKQWFLSDPHTEPPFMVHRGNDEMLPLPMVAYVNEVLPGLPEKDRPQTCVCIEGDVIYIPDGWFHGTLNLGASVSAASQLKTPSTAEVRASYELFSTAHRIFDILGNAASCKELSTQQEAEECNNVFGYFIKVVLSMEYKYRGNPFTSYVRTAVYEKMRDIWSLLESSHTAAHFPYSIKRLSRFARASDYYGYPDLALEILEDCTERARSVSSMLGRECWETYAYVLRGANRTKEARAASLVVKEMTLEHRRRFPFLHTNENENNNDAWLDQFVSQFSVSEETGSGTEEGKGKAGTANDSDGDDETTASESASEL